MRYRQRRALRQIRKRLRRRLRAESQPAAVLRERIRRECRATGWRLSPYNSVLRAQWYWFPRAWVGANCCGLFYQVAMPQEELLALGVIQLLYMPEAIAARGIAGLQALAYRTVFGGGDVRDLAPGDRSQVE